MAKIATRVCGMCIGNKNYMDSAYLSQMARVGMNVIGVYPGWSGDVGGSSFRRLIAAVKAKNPDCKIGQYTVITETKDDTSTGYTNRDIPLKVSAAKWWLRNAAGTRVQWTSQYDAFDIDFTEWAPRDSAGDRFPQWYAKRAHSKYTSLAPFDFIYSDNAMRWSRAPKANWRRDGVDRSGQDPDVQAAWRRGQAAYWNAMRNISGKPVMGNADNDLGFPEYAEQLDYAFIEGAIGKSWSFTTWQLMWNRYVGQMKNLKNPKGAILNAFGTKTDYAKMRYGLATVLLGDGMFCYTDSVVHYSSVPWFDEYDIDPGAPKYAVGPSEPLPGTTIWRRTYDNIAAYVNTGGASSTVTVPAGWRKFKGTQDPVTNNGQPVTSMSMPPKSGIILVKI